MMNLLISEYDKCIPKNPDTLFGVSRSKGFINSLTRWIDVIIDSIYVSQIFGMSNHKVYKNSSSRHTRLINNSLELETLKGTVVGTKYFLWQQSISFQLQLM